MRPIVNDRPHCLMCNIEMLFRTREPLAPDYNLRKFECPRGGSIIRLAGKTSPKPHPPHEDQ